MTSQLLTGYVSAFAEIIVSAVSASCAQALHGAIPDFQLSVARSVVQLVLYIIGGKLLGSSCKVRKETIPGLLGFGVASIVSNVGWFGSTTYLPLTEAGGIGTIATIVTVLVYSNLFFNTDITKSNIISSLVCVVGVILAAQPSWLFRGMDDMYNSTLSVSERFCSMNISSQCRIIDATSGSQMFLGYSLAVMGGTGFGILFVVNRLILHDVKPLVKVTYGALFSLIGSVVFMFYLEDPVLMIDFRQLMFTAAHAILSAAVSFLTILASHCLPGSSLSVIYSLQIVTMLVSQYTFMHSIQPGNYNWIEVLGCIIIVTGACIPPTLDILVHRAKADELP